MDIQISSPYKKSSNLLRAVTARWKRFAASYKDNAKILIALVDDSMMKELNGRFKNLEKTTNVLSFEMNQTDPEDGSFILGEIIVCVDTAKREALHAGMPVCDRLTELFIHGLVHLSGYDHTINKREAVRMRRKEKELMKEFSMIDKKSGKRV